MTSGALTHYSCEAGNSPTGPEATLHKRAAYHSAFHGPVMYTAEPRPAGADDELITAQTIARMIRYAIEDSKSPSVIHAAREAVSQARRQNRRGYAAAIHAWIRAHVRFVEDAELAQGIASDPSQAEVLVRPVDLLAMDDPQGDCDDFSMLCAAMLRAIGIGCAFKTVAANADDPASYSHVYVIADVGRPLALDCSHGPYAGWEAKPAGKTRLWPLEGRMNGLGIIEGDNVDSSDTSWWQDLISQGVDISGDIFKARYGVPQVEPGQTVRLPNGTVAAQLPYGAGPAVQSTANTGMLFLIIAGVIAVVLISNSKN